MAMGPDGKVQIPVLDISPSNSEASRQIVEAAAHYGFIFIKNNGAGIPPQEIAAMFQLVMPLF